MKKNKIVLDSISPSLYAFPNVFRGSSDFKDNALRDYIPKLGELSMSKQYNQQEFDSYMSSLLFAANASDIEHFENKVKQMLDTKASAVLSKLNEDEMKTFEELKTKLVNSSFNSESMYYEKEIDALIQNVSKRVS